MTPYSRSQHYHPHTDICIHPDRAAEMLSTITEAHNLLAHLAEHDTIVAEANEFFDYIDDGEHPTTIHTVLADLEHLINDLHQRLQDATVLIDPSPSTPEPRRQPLDL